MADDVASLTGGGGGGATPWPQLSGHSGNFRPGSLPGRVLKRLCQSEAECLLTIGREPRLAEFAPAFHGVVSQPDDGCQYVEMQDLLAGFSAPVSLMDCKIGCRTYLEEELETVRRDAKPRPDMFRRMSETDPDAPTPEQKSAGAVTKLEYMLWRERLSSTSTLAFRIDGLRCGGPGGRQPPCKDLKRLRKREDVLAVLRHFVEVGGGGGDASTLARAYLKRLLCLRDALTESEFFPGHELIGSSLLFAHDPTGRASVWMIDFGKTLPSPRPLSHSAEWVEGNHEDGYLTGLDSIIQLFRQLAGSHCGVE